MAKLTILGMDPPVKINCGWAVIEYDTDTKEVKLLRKFTQVIKNHDSSAGLAEVYNQVQSFYQNNSPQVLVMERQMGGGFEFGRAKLNEFVGVTKLFCHFASIPVVEISPAHMKMIIAGHGKAPKEVIIGNIVKTFGLAEDGVEHDCDAVAFALCYLIDQGHDFYKIKQEYTKEMFKAEKEAKAQRKKEREEKKKAKEALKEKGDKKAKVTIAKKSK